MGTDCRYIIDTCSFADSADRMYKFSFAPGFWEKLDEVISSGKIIVIDKVYAEATKGESELESWLKLHARKRIVKFENNRDAILFYQNNLIKYVHDNYAANQYQAWFGYSDVADPFIISMAKALNCEIITEEVSKTSVNQKTGLMKLVKVPDVANHFDIKCRHIFEVLEPLGFRWE